MKRLFIDDGEVEGIDNLARVLHQPAKFHGNAVLYPQHRWENCGIQVRTTPAWDPQGQQYRTIYHASAEGEEQAAGTRPGWSPGGESFACYATSADGVNWEKPFLGLHDYPATTWTGKPVGTQNNIAPTAQGMLQGPIYDRAEPDHRRRYKALAYGQGGLRALASADCIHWTETGARVPSADESNLTLDEARRLFIATVKHRGPYGRSFYLSTSQDFEGWSEQELIFCADQQDQENGFARLRRFLDDPAYLKPVFNRPEEWRTDVYNFPVFPYEGLYLGLPVMHHWLGSHPPTFENVDSRKTVELACSRDLRRWERVAQRAPFLELSPMGDGSAYDTGQLVVTNGPVVRNGELWFYYTGLRYRCRSFADLAARGYLDGSAACLARLRLDGFVGLRGGVEWGRVLTKPLEVTGSRLHVNADAWRGRVQAEIVDAASGQPLPGFARDDSVPAMEDRTDAVLAWKGAADLAALRGRTARVRFHLWQAELFAFWLGE